MAHHPSAGGRRRRRPARRGRDDQGYAIALFALFIVPVLIASALAIDVGSWYARITQLQRAADSAALAGTIWMPDLAKATDVAEETLRQNGIDPDASGMSVTVGPGQSPTSLKVSLTQTNVPSYFSQIAGYRQTLSRSAEAEYYLPLPLGSPLNYFGGDASKNAEQTTEDPPADATTRQPTNYSPSSCRVKGTNGWWRANGTYTTASNGRPTNPLCTWALSTTNQIDPSQSPGFWATIAGPGTLAARGDAFSAICTGGSASSANCGAPVQGNKMYRSTGYWYVIKMPASGASTTTVSIYDAAYDETNCADNNAGDASQDPYCSSNGIEFNTEFRMYKQDSPLDPNVRTPLGSASANTADGSCNWKLSNEARFLTQWQPLCTISNPQAGATYLLNVRTSSSNYKGSGINGYAVKAVSTGSAQPAVYAYGDMAMFNNIAGGDATFYLAEVGPEYAGKVLNVELWDPGDSTAKATIYPMMPSTTATRPVVNVKASDCTYTASPSPNSATSASDPQYKTGSIISSPHASDVSGTCGVVTNTGGNGKNVFNDEWLRIRIKVPSTYTCTKGLNPEKVAGSCWWGIKYVFEGQGAANDVTTWKANIEGNPVHLVQ